MATKKIQDRWSGKRDTSLKVKVRDILCSKYGEDTDTKWQQVINLLEETYKPLYPKVILDGFLAAKGTIFEMDSLRISINPLTFDVPNLPNVAPWPKKSKEVKEFDNYWETSSNADRIRLAIKDYRSSRDRYYDMSRKIMCVLNDIKTEQELKQEFPEAYKVFLEHADDIIKETSKNCDAIEEVRAQLAAGTSSITEKTKLPKVKNKK